MVGQGAYPLPVQPVGDGVDLLAGQAVDDAAFPLVLLQEIPQLFARLVALGDGVGDVGAVEAGGEDARGAEREAVDDVGAGERVGGGGERDARHAGEGGGDGGELAV